MRDWRDDPFAARRLQLLEEVRRGAEERLDDVPLHLVLSREQRTRRVAESMTELERYVHGWLMAYPGDPCDLFDRERRIAFDWQRVADGRRELAGLGASGEPIVR